MGNARPRQKNLAKKLRQIRHALGASQIQMVKLMVVEGTLAYHRISEFESGRREPSLAILLTYARVAGVHLEDIVDDNRDLPETLPGKVKYDL